ncbi:LysE family transporter [Kordiimonas sp. SCSIO 12603]|uniref:LysE family translocator n=1 Tax=Kordiimonas sp. SCSIO 12603 TaxID=2829596 RepID=UPI00210211AF|nr:LysE family transporter [Kordiimonas sp. SCSIO 12603]UTW57983.1 LysE family transporter [Kordiimonas sp. SCSIO 12603]
MMEPIGYLLWGLGFGIALSAPVGPINIIVLRRALFGKASDGFFIGLGGAFGDAFYAALAAFGLNAIFDMIEEHEMSLKIVGGIIMLVFAYRIWKAHPHIDRTPKQGGVKRGMFGSLVLTLTNPGVFLGFVGLYTLAGLGSLGNAESWWLNMNAIMLTSGVFLGAAAWWAILVVMAQKFREKINDKLLVKINHVSAAVIGLFALVTLGSVLLP